MTHTIHTNADPAEVVVLDLGVTTPPLTLNQRLHRHPKASITAELRENVANLARRLGMPPMIHPAVQLVWLVESRHARDEDNIVATLKAACDGLVDAGIAADDTPKHMHKPMPHIAYARGHHKAPGLFLVIWEHHGPTEEQARALDALAVRTGVDL
ncbi:hypothetical protein A9Z40_02965 [Microbacterium arborescens]|uniref:Uncharacterized protein n=1 Tax=Microbacterium arborescens TaxID=33883 RepID=A0ABX2WI74_9MICO|nr:hypothetical protein [Microbacterium arborescens]OAZ40917.1 hypothetical protein A9Z40_02965 [Microbacterium arborescens]